MNPLENIYKLGDQVNKWLKKSKKLDNCKVVSIGNITTGGTGKTPAVIYCAKILQSEGYKVAILSRGYGGSKMNEGAILTDGQSVFLTAEESGDEPNLIARSLSGIPIAVGKNRYAMAQKIQENYEIDIFLLDDGFQHYALSRDVDIVLIDANNPFGNGHLLPQGPLREPVSALRRADIIILTKTNLANEIELQELTQYVKKVSGKEFIFHSIHEAVELVKIPISKKKSKLNEIANESVWALSGIASHRSFSSTLVKLGASEVKDISFRDHYNYTEKDIESILKRVANYDLVITTEKDWMRLEKFSKQLEVLRKAYYLRIEFNIPENSVLFKEGLKGKILAGKVANAGN